MSIFLDLALRSSIVLVLGLAARLLLRHRSAALRHRVLAASLFASASVLPLTFVLPEWSVPVSRSAPAATTVSVDEPYVGAAASHMDAVSSGRSVLPLAVIWAIGVAVEGQPQPDGRAA